MSDVSESAERGAKAAGFSRKLGPLPIWAWAIIGVGIAALVYWYIRKQQTTPIADDNGAGLAATTDQTAAGALSSLYGGNASGYQSTYSNNNEYEQAAISELSGSSQYSPLQVQTALGDLFSGNSLSTTEQSIINSIESALGAPPESTPTPILAPPTSTGSASPTGLAINSANFATSVLSKNSKGEITAYSITNKTTGQSTTVTSKNVAANGHQTVNDTFNSIQNLLTGGNKATTQTAGNTANTLLKGIGGV